MAESRLGNRVDAGDSPGLALWQATHRWQALMRATLEPHDLTHVQFVLLATLVWLTDHADEPVSQVALAEFAECDVMMTSQVVRVLEAKGLVRRAAHPRDGRARVLTPTDAGVAAARAATRDVEEADARFFAPLSDPTAFARDLGRLRRD